MTPALLLFLPAPHALIFGEAKKWGGGRMLFTAVSYFLSIL